MTYYNKIWCEKYELAKAYYEHHKNLNIRRDFKTKNGYEYHKDGFNLGAWINTQRCKYKSNKLTKVRIYLLNKIGMIWDYNEYIWCEKYKLAKEYYKDYGNLNIPCNYKTIHGIQLGKWIETQRLAYLGKNDVVITKRHIELLDKIKIRWFLNEINLLRQEINQRNKDNINAELLKKINKLLEIVNHYEIKSKEDVDNINKYFMLSLSKK